MYASAIRVRITQFGMENDMKVESWPIDKVIPYDKNPRINKKAVQFVVNSIRKFGFRQPIVVDKDGIIIVGHTRLLAAYELGYKEVPVHVALDLTPEQIRAYRIADNKTAEKAEWDMDLLKFEIGELPDVDMTEFGFDQKELDDLFDDDDENEKDSPPLIDKADELQKKWKTELGQLWQLGEHQILCGDSIKDDDVKRLMGDDKATICWTDPPWNVSYVGKSKNALTIENDNLGDNFGEFADGFCKGICEALVPGGILYMAMSAQEWGVIMTALEGAGFHWSSTIIWNKSTMVMSRKDYHTKYEPIWYGWRGDAPRVVPLLDRTQTDVWDIERPSKSEEHPTMKPVELVTRALKNSSAKGSIVFEPFSGSGTTIIACEQTGRKCRAIELSPGYVAVALQRWADATGQTPVIID